MQKTWSDFGISGVPTTFSGDRKVKCPKCSHKRQKNPNEPCLSVNGDKGTWNCHHCGWSGCLEQSSETKTYRRPQIKVPESESMAPDVAKWFAGRGIGVDALHALKIFSTSHWMPAVGKPTLCMAFPFFKNGELVNIKYRDARKNMAQEKGSEPCMFNIDACRDVETIAICEGEIDAATLVECGILPTCSVDNGAPNPDDEKVDGKLACVKNCKEVLDSADKIILITDKDAPGLRLEKELIKLLGPEKCLQVRYPADCKDINDVLMKHGKEAVAKVIDGAFPVPVPGLHEFNDYSQDLDRYYNHGAPRGLTTGWDEFDRIFTMAPGTLNVITGIPTSGKSEWCHALIINMIRLHGWRWGLFSPEMLPVENLIQNFSEKIVGKKFFGKPDDRITFDEFQRAKNFCNENIKLLIPDEDESVNLDRILEVARVWIQRYNINGILLDPYNEIEHTRPAFMTETEYTSFFLGRLRTFARLHKVWVGIVAHPTKLQKDDRTKDYPVPTLYNISGSANWFNKPDYGLSIWRSLEAKDDTTVEVHVQKAKSKWIGRKGEQKFIWDRNTGRYEVHHEDIEPTGNFNGFNSSQSSLYE